MKTSDRITSVAQLKARLSHYLRLVQRGESVVVTHRGRPIATLEPVPEAQVRDERARRLVAEGRARAGRGRLPAGFWDRERPRDPEGRSLAVMLEEREEGR